MNRKTDFTRLVTEFLTDYLPNERGLSKNTIASYKTALSLFIEFIENEKKISLNRFYVKDINRELIKDFIRWLKSRKNSRGTMSQRLSAMKVFLEYAKIEKIEWIEPLSHAQTLRLRHVSHKETSYLSVDQMKRLINRPDVHSPNGLRHKVILALLYDCGCRVSELCNIRMSDIETGSNPSVQILGKGNKARRVILSRECADLVNHYIKRERSRARPQDPLIPGHQKSGDRGRNNHPLSRSAVNYVINKYVQEIVKEDPKFPADIHPHSFRKSRAMHLLEAEVPLIYIRDFLGHSQITTTEIYAKTSLKKKEKAIKEKSVPVIELDEEEVDDDWNDSEDLDEFLKKFKP